jgi:hypothetical protein
MSGGGVYLGPNPDFESEGPLATSIPREFSVKFPEYLIEALGDRFKSVPVPDPSPKRNELPVYDPQTETWSGEKHPTLDGKITGFNSSYDPKNPKPPEYLERRIELGQLMLRLDDPKTVYGYIVFYRTDHGIGDYGDFANPGWCYSWAMARAFAACGYYVSRTKPKFTLEADDESKIHFGVTLPDEAFQKLVNQDGGLTKDYRSTRNREYLLPINSL